MKRFRCITVSLAWLIPVTLTWAQGPDPARTVSRDLSRDPVLYTVGYAHLDTEWRWDYETTVREYLKNTLDENFRLFEKYPSYVFTFSGARRYRMMKEYYPDRYEKLKKYVAQERWFPGGSSVDECDVNIPSPESVIRQVLYGNNYFRSEFGKESVDFLLPDCFGFQAHLPSVLAHAGLSGFSTQKLSWGSANGIPFRIGVWKGPDGKGITSALDATDYNGRVKPGLDTSAYWTGRVMENGRKYGVFADYRYFGVGDVGGSPREDDVKNAVAAAGKPDSPIRVRLTSSDQFFRDLPSGLREKLPVYAGDLLLTEHSSGSLTSQAYMKRWNRKNEQLAQAAELLASAAAWLGAAPYPSDRLKEAWWLVLGSQMHDILPGTSLPKAYEYAWNDEVLALNQFASCLTASVSAVAGAMDTRGAGKTLVVYNPLAIARTDPAEAVIRYPGGAPRSVRITGPDGKEVPVQILSATPEELHILFVASVPPAGLACFDVVPGASSTPPAEPMKTTSKGIENEFIRLTINDSGDISGLFDKRLGREMLSGPVRLVFQKEYPEYWPAWNMDWNDRKEPPAGYVDGPPRLSVMENGPVRSSVMIERRARNSVFTQWIRLTAGQDVVRVDNRIRWQSAGVSLKVSFPLAASNAEANYNLGLGVVARGNNEEKKFEVPSREWFDLTDRSGAFGMTLLEDCKFGSDKPDDRTIRLTLLHTPVTNFYHDQATQDWGIHDLTYGLYPHRGDWRSALSEWQARRLNQPLKVFLAEPHPGILGKSFSFASVSVPQVDIRAIKQAEKGSDLIVRLQELTGRAQEGAEVTLGAKIVKAWEVDGQERLTGEATVRNGKLIVDMPSFAMRSFAVQLAPPGQKIQAPYAAELPVVYDQDVVAGARGRSDGRFDAAGTSIPEELFPEKLTMNGVPFQLGPKVPGRKNAIVCRGQKILLPKPAGPSRICLLAAAGSDTTGLFKVDGVKIPRQIQSFTGRIGSFDNRTWDRYGRINGLEKGFIRRDEVAWYASHLYRDTVVQPYQYGYLYFYSLPAGPETQVVELPDNESIRIFAITLAGNPGGDVLPAFPLYDDFSGRVPMQPEIPASYADESLIPKATVASFSQNDLAKLPARLTMKDYADLHQPNGATVTYFGIPSPDRPGAGEKPSGVAVTAMNDGMFELMPGDSVSDRWLTEGEGRILLDLRKATTIDSLHLFTTQHTRRGAMSFSLWGSDQAALPSVTGDPRKTGWDFIAYAPKRDVWGNRKVLYTLKPEPGKVLKYRYLMWISDHSAYGPFYFREIDLFERQF